MGAAGTLVRVVVVVALIAVVSAAPLFLVYRSKCEERRAKEETRWTFVLPGDDPPSDCRVNETGFDVLRDYVGL